jgi:hypothetical protein
LIGLSEARRAFARFGPSQNLPQKGTGFFFHGVFPPFLEDDG